MIKKVSRNFLKAAADYVWQAKANINTSFLGLGIVIHLEREPLRFVCMGFGYNRGQLAHDERVRAETDPYFRLGRRLQREYIRWRKKKL